MDHRTAGRTGLRVSPLCLGTMNVAGIDEILPGPAGPAPEAYAW